MPYPLPDILVIDDLLYHEKADRESFLEKFALKEAPHLDPTDPRPELGIGYSEDSDRYLGVAHFHPGQTQSSSGFANSVDATISAIASGWPSSSKPRWSLILLDQVFRPPGPGKQADAHHGTAILEAASTRFLYRSAFEDEPRDFKLDVPVVAFTDADRKEVEEKLDTLGALAFLPKTGSAIELSDLLFRYGLIEDGALRCLLREGDRVASQPRAGDLIVGRSLSLLRCLRTARRYVERSNSKKSYGPICIRGEPGVGKELIAQYMRDIREPHRLPTARGWYPLDLNALPETLLDAEIFGAYEGSYTGQPSGRILSAFDRAGSGTLFLDEIGNLASHLLKKLLRALGEGRFVPMGSPTPPQLEGWAKVIKGIRANDQLKDHIKNVENMLRQLLSGDSFAAHSDDRDGTAQFANKNTNKKERDIKCQVIFATNRDLEEQVAQGEFPRDLYERFAGQVFVPPLRERGDDKLLLADTFARARGKSITEGARNFVNEVQWFGNVRELRRAITQAARDRMYSSAIQAEDIHRHMNQLLLAREDSRRPMSIAQITNWLNGVSAGRTTREELRGVFESLKAALGPVVQSVLQVAIENFEGRGGRVNRTAAGRHLFDDNSLSSQDVVTAAQALKALGVPESWLTEKGFLQ